MRRLALLLLVGVGALWAPPGWATDGDACEHIATTRTARHGWEVQCTVVCDAKDENDTSCSTYTIKEPADTYTFEIAFANDCTEAATVTIFEQGGSFNDTHNLTALDAGGTTSVVIDGSAAHPLPRIGFALSAMTGCTDFTVKLWTYFKRGTP